MTDTDATLRVIGGVDTHKDVHVAAVLDELGSLLATSSFAATPTGHKQLARWWVSSARSWRWASRAAALGVPGWPVDATETSDPHGAR